MLRSCWILGCAGFAGLLFASVCAAAVAAIVYRVPDFFPFLSPGKGTFADKADFSRQVFFSCCFHTMQFRLRQGRQQISCCYFPAAISGNIALHLGFFPRGFRGDFFKTFCVDCRASVAPDTGHRRLQKGVAFSSRPLRRCVAGASDQYKAR